MEDVRFAPLPGAVDELEASRHTNWQRAGERANRHAAGEHESWNRAGEYTHWRRAGEHANRHAAGQQINWERDGDRANRHAAGEHINWNRTGEHMNWRRAGEHATGQAVGEYMHWDRAGERANWQACSPENLDPETSGTESECESEGFQSQIGSISPVQSGRSPRQPASPIPHQLINQLQQRDQQSQGVRQGVAQSQPDSRSSQPAPPIPPQIVDQFQQQDRQRQGVRQAVGQSQQAMSRDLDFVQAQVHLWQDRCWHCTQQGRAAEHDLYQCPHGHQTAAKAWFSHVRRHIKYAAFSGCFQCGLPQTICQRWQHGGSCAYRGVVIAMIAMMVHGNGTEGIRQAWQRRLRGFGVAAEDHAAVVRFLGQRHGAAEVSELVQEFIWLRKAWMEVGEQHSVQ